MTKRRTAERAVIEAAKEWLVLGSTNETERPGSYPEYVRALGRLREVTRKLLALDLEPATATRTTALPLATSADAAAYMSKRVNHVVGEVFGQVLSAFRAGAVGLTTDAIEVRLKRSHQSVSPRVTDLRDQAWIEPSGLTRPTRYGQPATVWTPTQPALLLAAHIPEWSW